MIPPSGDNSDVLFKRLLILQLLVYFIFALFIEMIPYTPKIIKSPLRPQRIVKLTEISVKEPKLTDEQKRRQEERRLAEERRLMEERRRQELERQRLEEQKRSEEEQRRRLEAQKRSEEEKRLADERKHTEEQKRLAEERRAAEEQRRIEEEKRLAEKRQRIEEQKRLEEERRLAEEQRRIEEQKRIEEEKRLAKEKNREVAKSSGLLKTMKGGKPADDFIEDKEISSVLSAPSDKLIQSPQGKPQTAGPKERTPVQKTIPSLAKEAEKGLKGSEGIGDVSETLAIKTPSTGLSGERRVADIEIKQIDIGGGGGGSGAGEDDTSVVHPRRTQKAIKEVVATHRGSLDFIYKKALRNNPT